MTYAERLATFATQLNFPDLPAEAQAKVKHLMATTMGVGFASSRYPMAGAFVQLAENCSQEESLLLGRSTFAPAPSAAAFHATVCDGLAFDETHPAGPIHPATIVVPVCFALAQAHGASGSALLAGIAVGLEAACRMAVAAAGQFHERGFYSTAVIGAPAAALGASRILDLPTRTAMNAFALASTVSGLTHEPFVGGHIGTKNAAIGWAAQGAATSVLLAQAGFAGPPTSIEGRDGIYEAFVGSGRYQLSRLDADLGTTWHLLDIMPKLYPVCHEGHAFVEAALQLRAKGFGEEPVDCIKAHTSELTARFMWLPTDREIAPATPMQGKFNLRYLLASALVRGRVDLDCFEEDRLADRDLWELTRKMMFTYDPALPYASFPADLLLELSDGRRERLQIPSARGTRDNPETPYEMLQKFEQCVQPVLGAERTQQLWQVLMSLELIPNVKEISPLMQP